MRRTYVQDPQTGRLVPKEEYRRRPPPTHFIMPDIQPFQSPLDQRELSSRSRLREHNAEHGVVQTAEYGPDGGRAYFERASREREQRRLGQTRQDRQERTEALIRATEQVMRGQR